VNTIRQLRNRASSLLKRASVPSILAKFDELDQGLNITSLQNQGLLPQRYSPTPQSTDLTNLRNFIAT